jgi:hypothetical protein
MHNKIALMHFYQSVCRFQEAQYQNDSERNHESTLIFYRYISRNSDEQIDVPEHFRKHIIKNLFRYEQDIYHDAADWCLRHLCTDYWLNFKNEVIKATIGSNHHVANMETHFENVESDEDDYDNDDDYDDDTDSIDDGSRLVSFSNHSINEGSHCDNKNNNDNDNNITNENKYTEKKIKNTKNSINLTKKHQKSKRKEIQVPTATATNEEMFKDNSTSNVKDFAKKAAVRFSEKFCEEQNFKRKSLLAFSDKDNDKNKADKNAEEKNDNNDNNNDEDDNNDEDYDDEDEDEESNKSDNGDGNSVGETTSLDKPIENNTRKKSSLNINRKSTIDFLKSSLMTSKKRLSINFRKKNKSKSKQKKYKITRDELHPSLTKQQQNNTKDIASIPRNTIGAPRIAHGFSISMLNIHQSSMKFQTSMNKSMSMKNRIKNYAMYDVLEHPQCCSIFKEYLEKEGLSQTLMFFIEVQEFSRIPSVDFQLIRGQKIYNKYLHELSITPIPITSKIRDDISNKLHQQLVTPSLFKEAYDSVLKYIETFQYPRFQTSKEVNRVVNILSTEVFSKNISIRRNSIVLQPIKVYDTKSLRAILKNQRTTRYFKDFCETRFCNENLLFYLDIENYIHLPGSDYMKRVACKIYKKYIAENSTMQVNISYQIKQKIFDNLLSGDRFLFQKVFTIIIFLIFVFFSK